MSELRLTVIQDQAISFLRHLPIQSTLHIRPALLQEIITRLEEASPDFRL